MSRNKPREGGGGKARWHPPMGPSHTDQKHATFMCRKLFFFKLPLVYSNTSVNGLEYISTPKRVKRKTNTTRDGKSDRRLISVKETECHTCATYVSPFDLKLFSFFTQNVRVPVGVTAAPQSCRIILAFLTATLFVIQNNRWIRTTRITTPAQLEHFFAYNCTVRLERGCPTSRSHRR